MIMLPAFVAIIFALVPLLFGALIYFSIKKSQANRLRWDETARSLGLQHTFEKTFFGQRVGPMTGTRDGFHVRVHTFTRSQGESSSTHTSVEVMPPSDLDLGLHISPEHLFTGVSKMFGTQDIQVGDQSFDDAFLIQGNCPENIIALLTPAVRQQLLALNAQNASLKLTDRGLYQEWSGMITDPHKIHAAINQQLQLMHQLSQAQSRHVMSQATVSALA